jgi:hypothetical protein
MDCRRRHARAAAVDRAGGGHEALHRRQVLNDIGGGHLARLGNIAAERTVTGKGDLSIACLMEEPTTTIVFSASFASETFAGVPCAEAALETKAALNASGAVLSFNILLIVDAIRNSSLFCPSYAIALHDGHFFAITTVAIYLPML